MSRKSRQRGPKAFIDLHRITEDQRIDIIGHTVMTDRQTLCFMVDDEPADKADRYIGKLRARFPGIVVLDKTPGPVAGVITVRVSPPSTTMN